MKRYIHIYICIYIYVYIDVYIYIYVMIIYLYVRALLLLHVWKICQVEQSSKRSGLGEGHLDNKFHINIAPNSHFNDVLVPIHQYRSIPGFILRSMLRFIVILILIISISFSIIIWMLMTMIIMQTIILSIEYIFFPYTHSIQKSTNSQIFGLGALENVRTWPWSPQHSASTTGTRDTAHCG